MFKDDLFLPLFGEALTLIRRHWKVYLGLLVLLALHSVIFEWMGGASSFSVEDTAGIVKVFVGAFVTLWISIVIVFTTHQLADGKSAPWGETFAQSFKRFFPVFFPTLLAEFKVVFGALVIIPGIYFAVLYSILTPVALFEHGDQGTLSRCQELVRPQLKRLKSLVVVAILWIALSIYVTLIDDHPPAIDVALVPAWLLADVVLTLLYRRLKSLT